LVGNDCRKLCEHHRDILTQVQDKIDSIFPNGVPGDAEASRLAASFKKKRHGEMLECLRVIGHLSRKVSMLSDAELDDLEKAVNNLKKAWITSYPEHPLLTPKVQVIIDLVVKFARHYGTLGIFGEDGLEALHPMHSRVRALVKSMRNPTQRAKAEQGHLLTTQKFRF